VAAARPSLDAEAALTHLTRAMALAQDLGMRPLVAHCYAGLGKLERDTGNRDGTHEYLTTATTMFRDMEMTFWLDKTAAEMRER
jgi:sugar phosphate isomerase/epimerase